MKSYEYYYLAKRNLLPDAEARKVLKGELKPRSRIHVSAVCGKAMASIACMLVEAGYKVTGSDVSFYPPMSDVLKNNKIECFSPDIKNLEYIELFVPGNMLPSGFLEVTCAREKNIPMLSGAEVVGELLASNKRSLVVAGTHGKTTTSSLLVHVFESSNKNPAYMIGGVFQGSENSFSLGDSSSTHAIFEGDEYDSAFFDKAPKFLRYKPTSVILTSIEHDHVDLYPTFEDYKQAFQFLVNELPENGYIVYEKSIDEIIDLLPCQAKKYSYGPGEDSDVRYKIISVHEDGTDFSLFFNEEKYNLSIPLFGEYNVANASAVFTLSLLEGLNPEGVIRAIKTYPGVCERQEKLGTTKDDITVFRDFAHHPTAVEVTLEGFRSRFTDKRIIAIFHPRSITSRRKVFEKIYSKSLSSSDVSIIISAPFKEGDNREDFLDADVIKADLESLGKKASVVANPKSVTGVLESIVKSGDVLVFMSNSNLENVPEDFLKNH